MGAFVKGGFDNINPALFNNPIIAVEDFYELKLNHPTRLIISSHGGHNGFIDGFFMKSWYEKKLADWFDEMALKVGNQG